jgi:UV excision repair protein RAD23
MKFSIKTLQQKTFILEADPSIKVSELKALIQESQGFPISQQKVDSFW